MAGLRLRRKAKTNPCPGCRADLGPQPARFCTRCGHRLRPEKCPECKVQVSSPDQSFCTGCGHQLDPTATRGQS